MHALLCKHFRRAGTELADLAQVRREGVQRIPSQHHPDLDATARQIPRQFRTKHCEFAGR
eukprot:64371-Rhodomonas_salina.1